MKHTNGQQAHDKSSLSLIIGEMKSNYNECGMLAQACNPSTRKAKAEESQVRVQPGQLRLQNETLSISKQTERGLKTRLCTKAFA